MSLSIRYLSFFFFLLCLFLSFQHSQKPLISDLYNYNDWFEKFRVWNFAESWAYHYDKGYTLLNLLFGKILQLDFRHLLFTGVLVVYLSFWNAAFGLRNSLDSKIYSCLSLFLILVLVPPEVSHFFRQVVASGLIVLAVTLGHGHRRNILGLLALSIHLSAFPYIFLMNAYDTLMDLLQKRYKAAIWALVTLCLSTAYFLYTHFHRVSEVMGAQGDGPFEWSVVIFWIFAGILSLISLFDTSDNFLLNLRIRTLSHLLFLSWLFLKFYFISRYFLSLRLNVYGGCFLTLLLLSSLKQQELNRWQKLFCALIIAAGIVYPYL